jgi:hypothetical protein
MKHCDDPCGLFCVYLECRLAKMAAFRKLSCRRVSKLIAVVPLHHHTIDGFAVLFPVVGYIVNDHGILKRRNSLNATLGGKRNLLEGYEWACGSPHGRAM